MNESETGKGTLERELPRLKQELVMWEGELALITTKVDRRRALIRAIHDELGIQPTFEAARKAVETGRGISEDRPLTARSVVLAVLIAADRPLTTRAVIDTARQRGLHPSVENPENAISASLSYLAKRGHVLKETLGSRIRWSLSDSGRDLARNNEVNELA